MARLLLQRTSPARSSCAPAPRARARPALDRAGDAAAGRHRARPARVPVALGGRGAVGLRRSGLAPRQFEEGIAAGRGGRPSQPVLVSIFMEGGWDALSVLAPVREAEVQRTAPHARARTKARAGVHRGRKPDVAPAGRRGWRQLHAEGKVAVFPAIGYDPPDESHFTSRHYWEVASSTRRRAPGWMGRYLDVAGDAGNPLQGLSLDYSLAPALATATRARRGGLVARPTTTCGPTGCGEPLTAPTLDAFGALGALSRASPALRPGPRRRATTRASSATQIAPFVEHEGKPGYTSPVTYPRGDEFPQRLAVLAAMLARRRCRSNASR